MKSLTEDQDKSLTEDQEETSKEATRKITMTVQSQWCQRKLTKNKS